MTLQQTNGPAPATGEKKKSNFKIGKLYGSDGIMDVSIYKSDKGGVYCILSIKAAVGKDPSTGQNVYVQKMSGELPSIFMNMDVCRSFIESAKAFEPSTLNGSVDTGRGSKMIIEGSESAVKITIENQKTGPGTITFDAIPVGPTNVHATFKNLVDMVTIAHKKMITNKLDPDEFSMVVSGDEEGDLPI